MALTGHLATAQKIDHVTCAHHPFININTFQTRFPLSGERARAKDANSNAAPEHLCPLMESNICHVALVHVSSHQIRSARLPSS